MDKGLLNPTKSETGVNFIYTRDTAKRMRILMCIFIAIFLICYLFVIRPVAAIILLLFTSLTRILIFVQ